jgi:hypothetical protein
MPQRVGLGARIEVRLDQKTKSRIRRAAKVFGKGVGDYVRGLCLADLGQREAERRERRGVARLTGGVGVGSLGQGRGKKGA